MIKVRLGLRFFDAGQLVRLGLAGWPALTNLTRWKPRDVCAALWGKRRHPPWILVEFSRGLLSLGDWLHGLWGSVWKLRGSCRGGFHRLELRARA